MPEPGARQPIKTSMATYFHFHAFFPIIFLPILSLLLPPFLCLLVHLPSVFMGNVEVPAPGARQPIKTSMGTYEFGANVIHDKVMTHGLSHS